MEVIADAGRRELSFDGFRFPLPAELDDASALALAHHGVTAWHLLRTCAHLRRGESVVVHDAAGGVGALVVQLAVSFGAGRVVATAPTQAQRRLALRLGADVAVDSAAPALAERLRTGGLVDVVVGLPPGRAVDGALAVLAPFGRLVYHVGPGGVGPADADLAGVGPARVGPAGVGPGGVGPARVGPAGVDPGGVDPASVGPGGVDLADVGPAGVGPADVDPAGVGPGGVDLAGVGPAGVGSAGVDPVRLGSRAVVGFRLADCLARPEMVVAALSELTGLTAAGRLHPLVPPARTAR